MTIAVSTWRQRKAAGLCPYCEAPATHGVMCEAHRVRHRGYGRKSQAARYLRRKVAGQCVTAGCPNGPGETSVLCTVCLAKEHVRRAKRRKSARFRQRHASDQRRWQKARKELGLCYECPLPAVTETCCQKHRERRLTGDRKRRDAKGPMVRLSRCSNCRKPGHNCATCTVRPANLTDFLEHYAVARNYVEAA